MQPRFPVKVLPLKAQVLLTPHPLVVPLISTLAPAFVLIAPYTEPGLIGQLLRQPGQVGVEVKNFLAARLAIDPRQRFIAVGIGIHVHAAEPMFHLLQQSQPLPHKLHIALRLFALVAVHLFADASSEWVIAVFTA